MAIDKGDNMFKKYQHIERFGADEVEGIDKGLCYVFPKLDGTNGSVWIENGEIKAGSRNRELTLDNDNQGFYSYITQHEGIKKYFEEFPDHILYGEWLVPHSLKTYQDDAWRKFYVFDVYDRNKERYKAIADYSAYLSLYDIDYISPLLIANNPTEKGIKDCLILNTYLISDGNGVGEGVVIKNYDYVNKYGHTLWAKIISNEFKEKRQKKFGSDIVDKNRLEYEIVDQFVTKSLIDKELAKIKADGWSSNKIPKLLGIIFHELIKEESWNIIKKFKNPTIDFKKLQTLTNSKIKQVLPELFN